MRPQLFSPQCTLWLNNLYRKISRNGSKTFNASLEHVLNIDFVNQAQGPGARVAVELSAEAARSLEETIFAVLDRAKTGGHLG
jgi:hypothetical protein